MEMEPQVMEMIRKRKRMQSNRESAKRSRQRKQQQLDDLTAQLSQFKNQNAQVLTTIGVTSQLYLGLEAENSVLRAQLVELTNRLQSLNHIIQYFVGTAPSTCNTMCSASPAATTVSSGSDPDSFDLGFDLDGFSMDSWVVPFDSADHPIMPALDSFLCL